MSWLTGSTDDPCTYQPHAEEMEPPEGFKKNNHGKQGPEHGHDIEVKPRRCRAE